MILTHGNTVAPVEAGHLLYFDIGILLHGIEQVLIAERLGQNSTAPAFI
jgi:hypothetical protein